MPIRTRSLAAMMLILGALATPSVMAAAPQSAPATVVRVSDMHCAACAKKIARKLYTVPGVVQVKTDLKQHRAVVVPEKSRQLDPLAVWKAVEAAGFAPVELNGPSGKFASKEEIEKSLQRTARRTQ